MALAARRLAAQMHPAWRTGSPAQRCAGHNNNITDLAWSPDGTLLASASLDNTVVVWDAASGHRVRTLAQHENYVKGVAWDPVGSFLAAQSDDRSVRVWRCEDWAPFGCAAEPWAAGYVQLYILVALGLVARWAEPAGRQRAAAALPHRATVGARVLEVALLFGRPHGSGRGRALQPPPAEPAAWPGAARAPHAALHAQPCQLKPLE